MPKVNYTEDNIRSLDWKEHIRMRPGMYIGKLGDGHAPDDGIYVLVKEIMDNSIDEFVMGAGKQIDINVDDTEVIIRDYGRGIPLGKVVDCVSKINTGGKYDSEAFKKSVGLNGVGTKAVNALSISFEVASYRDGKCKVARFAKGELVEEKKVVATKESNGTQVRFKPDPSIFVDYKFRADFIEQMIWNYAYLNAGLRLVFNGTKYVSQRGLLDLLERKTQSQDIRYPIIHLKGHDIEVAVTHGEQYGEEHYSFVNGQHTTMGGSHQSALREGVVRAIRDFFKKDYDASDIRSGMIAAISIKVQDPVFESQTKTKLGSQNVGPEGPTVRSWVVDFLKKELDNDLHRQPEVAIALQKKILQSEKERKEMAGIKKIATERAKKANLFNKKLRDCRVHLDSKKNRKDESTIFITEGDSASGSLTKARDVQTQAVFSLRGKPLNCFGLTKKVVYENEEFNLLQHALNVEDGVENLRYNNIIIATDADVDGMHIRLLLMTFFLQYFPELVREGHVQILQTPLFRVRNKEKTIYCYNDREKQAALGKIGKKAEITRFKGLGEISPKEFSQFIGDDMRVETVRMSQQTAVADLLSYFMGKNTQDRQKFIIDNLRAEEPIVEGAEA
ncbi:DNA topoisomerase IV subunit B [Pseudobacteriovorax antillogorgiicola]|uniref:DNA topoisomerase (ATP-hydrolyzing) n=1 Tax=Pseudobacteriovorax antillogorgiicola TaxID=1513793 RepID=A0A1Y6BUF2_9BACT|nr:DNA topoisomerase IV subunit B [Pseudobacteriovorax antillogorgiicola]TCS52378.1 topoisomerase-4 subunit B [Pseudobacteriovorax antillogorgiicola]SMF29281.1 topoisomerase-4 subunit B [Pseudobacteriovorax antillogorgiicola]